MVAILLSGATYGSAPLHDIYEASATQPDSTDVANKPSYGTTLSETDMNNRDQSSNAIDAIRGRVAGLTVERNAQNAMSAVRLRGTTSLAGDNDPLIIVDGVLGDMSLLEAVYPTDIESFRIMKDASETSLYGSRGASGVIEITTTKGKQGDLHIHYNGSLAVGAVYKTLDMLSADGYRRFAAAHHLPIIDMGCTTNWQRAISRTAVSHHHHLAFSGGSEKTAYRAGIGYIDDQQVVGNLGAQTFMSNLHLTQRMFDDVLTINFGMFGSYKREQQLFNEQKLFYSAACFNPTFPTEADDTGNYSGYPAASQIANPKTWLTNRVTPENAHISTNINMDFKLMEPLHLKLFAAYTFHLYDEAQSLPTENGGTAYRSTDKQHAILANMALVFNRKYGIHDLSATALTELQSDMRAGYYVTTDQASSAILLEDRLSGGALRPWEGTDSYQTKANMLSFMGKIGYTLLDRYSLNASVRTDGSSKFGKNNKWGVFPSISATWVISNEPWLSDNPTLDDLRLTAGYGLSGNQSGIDSYLTMNLYEPNGVTNIAGKSVVTYASLRNTNPDLKWEVSSTVNVGVDMSLFGGRLVTSLGYYHTLVTDMLYPYQVSTPPYTYPVLVANLGSMRNQGVEWSVGGTIVNMRDWKLTINANLTWQHNRLLSLSGYRGDEYLYAADYQPIASLSGAGSHGGDNDIVWQIVGEPLATFYLPKFMGMSGNREDGYTYRAGEWYTAGQATPKFLLGSNISLRYKHWDLSIQLNGAFGHKVFNGTSLAYMNLGALPYYNVLAKAPEADIYDQKVTDYWLENGDFLNIDYITLGYNIPLPVNKVVESLRLVLTMNDVATISGYSGLTPMINSTNINSTIGIDDKRTYPLTHSYTLGVSVGF